MAGSDDAFPVKYGTHLIKFDVTVPHEIAASVDVINANANTTTNIIILVDDAITSLSLLVFGAK